MKGFIVMAQTAANKIKKVFISAHTKAQAELVWKAHHPDKPLLRTSEWKAHMKLPKCSMGETGKIFTTQHPLAE